jgi:hypothetical protein
MRRVTPQAAATPGSLAMLTANPARLAPGRHPGLHRLGLARPAADVGERLPVAVAHDVAAGNLLGGPGRGEAAGRHPRIMIAIGRARQGAAPGGRSRADRSFAPEVRGHVGPPRYPERYPWWSCAGIPRSYFC